MNDSQIAKLCLLIAVSGIILLFAYTALLEPEAVKIGNIDDSMLGRKVLLEGAVRDLSEKDGNVFITLSDGNETDVVVFERTASNQPFVYHIEKNTAIRVVGKVESYNGRLEIIAEKIEKTG